MQHPVKIDLLTADCFQIDSSICTTNQTASRVNSKEQEGHSPAAVHHDMPHWKRCLIPHNKIHADLHSDLHVYYVTTQHVPTPIPKQVPIAYANLSIIFTATCTEWLHETSPWLLIACMVCQPTYKFQLHAGCTVLLTQPEVSYGMWSRTKCHI